MNRQAVIAVNRFGLGAAPGELAAAATDPRGWLAAQAAQSTPEYRALAELPASSEALKEYPRWVMGLRLARGDSNATMRAEGQPMVRGIEENFRDHFGPSMLKEVGARLAVAATTQAPFHERLVWFWA
ncbi:MAG: DUF1800 family protein, partial [Burkholderiales bacterium]